MTTSKKQQVKILGQMVTVGTKKWEILSQQVRIFNQIIKSENA